MGTPQRDTTPYLSLSAHVAGRNADPMSLPDVADILRSWDAVAAADRAFDEGDLLDAAARYERLTDGGSKFAYASYRAGLAYLHAGQPAIGEERLRQAAGLGHPAAMVEVATLVAPHEADEALALLLSAADSGYRDLGHLQREPALLGVLGSGDAADQIRGRMEPARQDEKRRLFDFWIGDWDVRAADGRPAGHNTIRSILGGAVIHEDWQSVAGWRGQSINFYDAQRDQWEQLWVQDDGSHTHYTDGRVVDGALRFASEAETGSRRLSFYALPNGWVRQVGEAADAAGSGWVVEYDLIYTPHG